MSVIVQKVQDISRLPAMCKHGYVAQVSNTGELETDDYYVKFEATNGDSGVGSWEECVRPHNFATNINTVYNWSQSNFVVTVTQLSGSFPLKMQYCLTIQERESAACSSLK